MTDPSSRVGATRVGWVCYPQADVPEGDHWLSCRERAALAALAFEPRRSDWRLGRWTAKAAVRAWFERRPDEPLESLEILAAPDGAPDAFEAGRAVPVALSLSHREGLAVCSVASAGRPIGCDLEVVEQRSEAFVQDWFTEEERAAVEAVPESLQPLVVTLLWSGKESALKASRDGLRRDTRDVVVRLGKWPEPDGRWGAFTVSGPGERDCFAGRWRRHLGHVLTVVVPHPWDADPVPLVPR